MNKKSIGIGIIIGIGAALAIGATSGGGGNPPSQPSYGDEPGRFVALEWEGGKIVNISPDGNQADIFILDTATGVICAKAFFFQEDETVQHCSGTFANYRR